MGTTRLRQVALVARDLDRAAACLRADLGLGDPFHDPSVGEFGLDNAVFAVGDTFLEVVAPVRAATTAGRYLDRLGGDGGYMAIFQVPDLDEARRRVAALGVRIVWTSDRADMAGTHLHPKDVPGAIVSLDWARPAGSWRWAGPAWAGSVPEHQPGGILGLRVEVSDPVEVGRRWAAVLGVDSEVDSDGVRIGLGDGSQTVRFGPCDAVRPGAITEVTLATVGRPRSAPGVVDVCGVRFVILALDGDEPAAGHSPQQH